MHIPVEIGCCVPISLSLVMVQPSTLRTNCVLQAVSSGEISAAEGAVKLVTYLQASLPNISHPQSAALQLLNGQPGIESVPRSAMPSMHQSASEPLQLTPADAKRDDQASMGMEQLDMEVPAPRKRLPMEEKLRSWLTEGVQVPAPSKANQHGHINGFPRNDTRSEYSSLDKNVRENRFAALCLPRSL